jgi:hypothetical protein
VTSSRRCWRFFGDTMATQPPVQEEQEQKPETVDAGRRRRLGTDATARPPLGQVLRELNWRILLLVGIAGGVLWTVLLAQGSAVTFFAGLLPVGGGIWVGRQVQRHVAWHAGMLSLITVLAAIVTTVLLEAANVVPVGFFQQVVALGLMALLPFPAFGVYTAHRSEARNRQAREERERRGGRLERPGRVKTLEDLRSLSLPQLGSYVADLFRKHDFKVQDYQIEQRENYIRFDMSYKDEPWVIRVTVDEKVKQGVVLQFFQWMKSEEVQRGVLITSMDFQDAAVRWAKDRPIALIDGPTLLSMND